VIRNPLQPYSPAVLALFFAGCVLACYAFSRAFERPERVWEGDNGD
jgi:hypothetical protein